MTSGGRRGCRDKNGWIEGRRAQRKAARGIYARLREWGGARFPTDVEPYQEAVGISIKRAQTCAVCSGTPARDTQRDHGTRANVWQRTLPEAVSAMYMDTFFYATGQWALEETW